MFLPMTFAVVLTAVAIISIAYGTERDPELDGAETAAGL